MRFWCQTFSLMFRKPHVMVLLIHRLNSLKTKIVELYPLLKSVGKLWETLGLITETFIFTRKGLIHLLPDKNVLICFAFQYDENLTHSTPIWIDDNTVDVWISMNSFQYRLLLPIRYGMSFAICQQHPQKDTVRAKLLSTTWALSVDGCMMDTDDIIAHYRS